MKMFPGDDFDESPPPKGSFSIVVTPMPEAGETFTDEVLFEYDTVRCKCSYYDGV